MDLNHRLILDERIVLPVFVCSAAGTLDVQIRRTVNVTELPPEIGVSSAVFL